MFDDNSQNQPTQDAGVTAEPAPGGVLGPAVATAPDASAAPANPVDSSFNTSPVDASAVMPDPIAVATPAPTQAASSPAGSEDLLNLKQQALQSLSPLLSHLDQTPEEKFKTTMMMIQASDDQTLVKSAYEAAQAIPDEKAKAQALLDIVNEINYFTQQGQKPA